MKKYHDINGISFVESKMILEVDGVQHEFELPEISASLSNATSEVREHYVISPSGYGIHWPLIDEDLSIDGLLGIVHTPQTQKISA